MEKAACHRPSDSERVNVISKRTAVVTPPFRYWYKNVRQHSVISTATYEEGSSLPMEPDRASGAGCDHAANERTFLAWVRTAISVMAFRFLVEKFDLFLEVAAPSLAGRTLSLPGQKFGNIAGLALIVLGTAMVAIAAIRFLVTAKNIDSEEPHPGPGSRIDVALALLLVLLG